MDANEADFEDKVIQRSREVPVVVDFWAPWCGPCRTLGPVLEKAIEATGGRVELVKVNTDDNQNLARRYQIQGIPAVKAFKDGQIVDEFVGAQPPQVVREFLSLLVPSQQQVAEEEALAQAAEKLAAGQLEAIEPLLAAIDPRGPRFDRVEAIRRMLELAHAARDYGGEDKARAAVAADEGDLEARYALGAALAARGQLREALEQFLEIVTRSRKFREDGGRLAMLVLFDLPTIDPEMTREFRRRLQIVT
jgi:putative thioredoxin